MAERKKFREVFQEDAKTESLSLLFDIKVKGTLYPKGTSFSSPAGLGGVDFHKFRYLDVALEKDGDTWDVKGFFTQE